MSETRPLLERVMECVEVRPFTLEGFHDRRDRKRRNQRITAGVVGIAVFVAAVWIVTSGLPFHHTAMPAASPTIQTTPPVSAVGSVPKTDYLLDLDTGGMTPLPKSIAGTAGAGASEYAASPDGSRLAFTQRSDDGERAIFLANLDGTGIEQVTHDLEAAYSPAWSPDGSKIAYIGYHDDRLQDVFVLDLATGESTQLTFATPEPDPAAPDMGPWRAWLPSFTPDGASIVYGADREKLDNVNKSEAEMRMVPVAGGESVRLMEGFNGADLSPDGSLLAYAWSTPISNCVCVSNADGTGERVLVAGGRDAINGTPWSPDGTRIAYYTFHAQNVFVVDVTTGQTTHVAEGSHPTWLDDQTLIVEINHCYNPISEQRAFPGCLA